MLESRGFRDRERLTLLDQERERDLIGARASVRGDARERFAAHARKRNEETAALFRRHGVDCVRIETGRDYIVPLSVFFKARARRR